MHGVRATVDLAPIGIAHFGLDGRFLLVNDRLCAILGFSREELLTRTFQEITFPDDLPRCAALNLQLATGSIQSYQHEKRFIRGDGSALWTRVTVSAIRDPDGVVDFFLGVAEDVTGQRLHEQALRNAEERLRAALDASNTGTFRWNIRTNAIDWDRNLDRLFGLDAGRRAQSLDDFLALIHTGDRQRVIEACWLCAGEGTDFREEFRVVVPNDAVHWLSGTGKTIDGPDASPLYMTGALTDVTERRRMEDELRESESRFRTLANAIPQMAWIADNEGRRSWYNDRWYEYSGLGFDELEGHGWHRVHHPDHLERVRAGQLDCARRGEVWEDTYPLRRHDGVSRRSLSLVPVPGRPHSRRAWADRSVAGHEHRHHRTQAGGVRARASAGPGARGARRSGARRPAARRSAGRRGARSAQSRAYHRAERVEPHGADAQRGSGEAAHPDHPALGEDDGEPDPGPARRAPHRVAPLRRASRAGRVWSAAERDAGAVRAPSAGAGPRAHR